MNVRHLALAIVSTSVLLTGCATGGAGHATVPQKTPDKTVQVAYAASLQYVNDTALSPAFTRATGIAYEGRGGSSFALAHLIEGGEITPSVFESVGTAPIDALGAKKPTWAVGFASSPLVIAYSPNSPYAAQLQAIAQGKKPLTSLFTLLLQPGFHLGRTSPETDPQGQSFILMMHLAETELHLSAGTANRILQTNDNPKQVFAEESILSTLQAGQLDAASAYLPEAVTHHLPYITLPSTINLGDPADAALYKTAHIQLNNGKTVTGKPIELYVTAIQSASGNAQGNSFIQYLLSPAGIAIYEKSGYKHTEFLTYGNAADIPGAILSEIQG